MITALLMTAGESRRMGRDNKLLLTFRDKTMVRLIAETLLASDVDEVIVVTGYQHKQIEEALAGLTVRFIHNPDFYSGMASGIRAGLDATTVETEAVMIVPADMPFLQPMHINALVKKYRSEKDLGKTPIIRPVYKAKDGYPVLFDRAFWDDIRACRDQDGCVPVIDQNKDDYVPYALANEAYYLGIDTPMDFYKLRE